jgi:hypothetical protein
MERDMADVRPRSGVPGAPSPDPRSVRNAWKQARLAAIRKSMEMPRVRVLPASEEIRRVPKHPRGMPFREHGSVEWPLDTFTHKRIAEGSITVESVEPRQERSTHATPHAPSQS